MNYNKGKLVSTRRITIQIYSKQTVDDWQLALKSSEDVCPKSPTNIPVKKYI